MPFARLRHLAPNEHAIMAAFDGSSHVYWEHLGTNSRKDV